MLPILVAGGLIIAVIGLAIPDKQAEDIEKKIDRLLTAKGKPKEELKKAD